MNSSSPPHPINGLSASRFGVGVVWVGGVGWTCPTTGQSGVRLIQYLSSAEGCEESLRGVSMRFRRPALGEQCSQTGVKGGDLWLPEARVFAWPGGKRSVFVAAASGDRQNGGNKVKPLIGLYLVSQPSPTLVWSLTLDQFSPGF